MQEAGHSHHQNEGRGEPKDPRHGPIEKGNTTDPVIDTAAIKPPYYGGPEGGGSEATPKTPK